MIIQGMTVPETPSSTSSERNTTLPDGVARLSNRGVILIQGEEAAKFIHGQLTHDFALLTPHEARLAAFCSAKGRMLASFVGFKNSQGDILLVCSRDLLEATLKRLSMFVLRAKARLSDASETYRVWGLAGNATKDIGEDSPSPWRKTEIASASGASTLIQLFPAGTVARQMLVTSSSEIPPGPVLEEALWEWGEVLSGVATITAPLAEAFVPQMLNYESVGGVSFKKGCYPGQEVVARSQFRGTLKRRTFLAHCVSPMKVGQELLANKDPDQVVGVVVQTAAGPGGGHDALVELQLTATDGPLNLLADGENKDKVGSAVALRPLPYKLLEDI
jgi:folate-binding protein YgfZ